MTLGKGTRGAASLYEQLDREIVVCLRDGRNFRGWLRSYDQYANLVLDGAVERLVSEEAYADVGVGVLVVRGENVMMLGEVDEAGELRFRRSRRPAPEPEVRRLMQQQRAAGGCVQRQRRQWPIPEEF